MTISLSPAQARKLVLHSQKLPPASQKGSALAATLSAIEHLGYVQIDTISVIQRAHHHTLWNRNPRYKAAQLDALIASRQVFEYWSHAAAYLPMRDFRFTLPRKKAIAEGRLNHWGARDKRLMRSVLKRIESEGPLRARDFVHNGKKIGDWSLKPAKQALEYLFMQGELMTARRENFHKVYDLTERVLPAGIDTSLPDASEHARFLVDRYLTANGLGQAAEMVYLLKDTKAGVSAALQDMLLGAELVEVDVKGATYYAKAESIELLDKPLRRSTAKILSPFDNLIIQRKRTKALFDFDYQLECYVPEAKRQFGYFVLPVLWQGRLAARLDCKAERKNAVLNVHHCYLEPQIKDTGAFVLSLAKALSQFAMFNNCDSIMLDRVAPRSVKAELQRELNKLHIS